MGTNENNDAFYKRNLAVPFFTQRDNTYIWQRKEKNGQIWKNDDGKEGPKYHMAWRSCNITSLCMVLHYWGLTEETPDQMLEKVFSKQEENVLDDNGALKTDKNGNPVTKWGWLHEATDEVNYPRTGAARNAEVENHGSSSFALVKYQMPESHGQFFYALYMHLKKIDLKQELEDFFL